MNQAEAALEKIKKIGFKKIALTQNNDGGYVIHFSAKRPKQHTHSYIMIHFNGDDEVTDVVSIHKNSVKSLMEILTDDD